MRIITANVNGIRSAAKKGFFDWMLAQDADVVCIQETKAQVHQLEQQRALFFPEGYHCYYHDAEKKGYSGVALYCRREPDELIIGMGNPVFDREGRYLEARFGNLGVASLYLPSGSSREERQLVKYRCMDYFETVLQQRVVAGRDLVVCGDWNIAHKNEDIRNWKSNQNTSGFLPQERAWLDKLFDDWGFVDAFRELPQPAHAYTWWSNRGQAWAKNVGWRIDYHVLSPSLGGTVESTGIYKEERFSDHAPLVIDYRFAGNQGLRQVRV
ncbi:MAG: exodeoxyribonuclease III [Thiothrix sp.]|nr:exodeoxyribonuclease III [Thiothrix sp.]HPQ96279.1 exodeoxyribonuclease III [Thiolinea sp.]